MNSNIRIPKRIHDNLKEIASNTHKSVHEILTFVDRYGEEHADNLHIIEYIQLGDTDNIDYKDRKQVRTSYSEKEVISMCVKNDTYLITYTRRIKRVYLRQTLYDFEYIRLLEITQALKCKFKDTFMYMEILSKVDGILSHTLKVGDMSKSKHNHTYYMRPMHGNVDVYARGDNSTGYFINWQQDEHMLANGSDILYTFNPQALDSDYTKTVTTDIVEAEIIEQLITDFGVDEYTAMQHYIDLSLPNPYRNTYPQQATTHTLNIGGVPGGLEVWYEFSKLANTEEHLHTFNVLCGEAYTTHNTQLELTIKQTKLLTPIWNKYDGKQVDFINNFADCVYDRFTGSVLPNKEPLRGVYDNMPSDIIELYIDEYNFNENLKEYEEYNK